MADVKIIDHTKEAIEAKDEAVERALEIIGGFMERYAKQNCPVDTGLLRNSITFVMALHPGSTFRVVSGTDGGGTQFTSSSTGASRYGAQEGVETDENNVVVVGTNVHYARYVEFGAKGRKGKYFIRDSVANHIDEYRKIIANELKKVQE